LSDAVSDGPPVDLIWRSKYYLTPTVTGCKGPDTNKPTTKWNQQTVPTLTNNTQN